MSDIELAQSVSAEMAKPNIVLDATMLDTFQSCPYKFWCRFVRNKGPQEKAKALDRGSVGHMALEGYYKALQLGCDYSECIQAMRSSFAEAMMQSELDDETETHLNRSLHQVVEYYRTADKQFEIVAVEQPFMYKLTETEDVNIFMTGKIDLLVNDEKYTNLPIDHKFRERDSKLADRRLNTQFINYANAVGSNFLIVNKVGLQKTLSESERFKRTPLSFDPVYKQQWIDEVVIPAATLYLECCATDKWPLNLTSCDKFNRLCEYYEICDSSGQDSKVFKLEANFIDVPAWDVTDVMTKREH